jgi:GNAT superfamily N-acetyltransferase
MKVSVQIRRAIEEDAPAIAVAHLDSIRAIGPSYYSQELVAAWAEGLTADVYTRAMQGGEAFFIATGELDGEQVVLGFSTHRVDDDQDGVAVYVRGRAARRGIGTALLRLAEQDARSRGATTIQIQATLAGVEFWRANGFEELERVDAPLRSGGTIPCVSMRKRLA